MASKQQISVIDENRSPTATILMLAWPVILEQLLVSLVNSVDVAMVGSLGKVATAAVSISGSPMMMINGIVMSFSVGFTVLIARYVGANDINRAKELIRQALTTVVLMGAPLALICFLLSGAIPRWMGAEPDVLILATQYNKWIAAGMLFRTLSMVLTAIYRGYGDTKTPLFINTGVNLTNVVLNFLFIYPTREITFLGNTFTMWGVGLGVQGAAMATSFAGILGALVMLFLTFNRKTPLQIKLSESFRLDKATMKQVSHISLPSVFERFTMSSASVVVASVVASLGTVAVASNSLAGTAESFCFMPAFAFGTVATTLMGQSLGAKRLDLAEKYIAACAKIGSTVMVIMCTFLFVFAKTVIGFFTPDPEVIEIASTLLRILATIQVPYLLSLVYSGALRGAGDTKSTFYITLFSMWGIRILGAVVSVKVLGFGIYAVCVSMCADNVMRMFLFFTRYKKGAWKKAHEKKPEETTATAQA